MGGIVVRFVFSAAVKTRAGRRRFTVVGGGSNEFHQIQGDILIAPGDLCCKRVHFGSSKKLRVVLLYRFLYPERREGTFLKSRSGARDPYCFISRARRGISMRKKTASAPQRIGRLL